MLIATIVASETLGQGEVAEALDRIAAVGAIPAETIPLEPGKAVDIRFSGDGAAVRAALQAMPGTHDVVVQPEETRAKALLIADMDSTMITVECIDELADYAGIKAQIADVTARAMPCA